MGINEPRQDGQRRYVLQTKPIITVNIVSPKWAAQSTPSEQKGKKRWKYELIHENSEHTHTHTTYAVM